MALINCPECGHRISDQSTSCVNCGLPSSKMILIINCPECSEPVYNQAPSCSNCGFPIAKPASLEKASPSYKEMKLFKELDLENTLGEQRESKLSGYTIIFIISCIVIYMFAKEDIHYILQHL